MTEIKHVLCPIDFSEFSRHAMDYAAALAQRHGARLTVLHAFEIVAVPDGSSPPALMLPFPSRDEVAKELALFVEPLKNGPVPVAVLVQEGHPARTIIDKANELTVDLIVLGTHGRGGFEHLVLGSVTEKVLRKASCPVLIVPPSVTHRPGPVDFRRILCPIDFGPSSSRALEYAIAVVEEAQGRLTVLHVLESLDDVARSAPVDIPEYRRLREEQARDQLHAAMSAVAGAHSECVELLATGKPHREIVRIARESGADLVVMGVAGRGALRQLFLGSTTNHVVREATCPVLTLRAPQTRHVEHEGDEHASVTPLA